MTSVRLHSFLCALGLVLGGLIALSIGAVQGSLETVGLGALALLIGGAFTAFLIWDQNQKSDPL